MDIYLNSFVPFWQFLFVNGSFQAVYTKSMYFGPTVSCVILAKRQSIVVCPMHAFTPCWIAVQYVTRVLHFSAFRLFFIVVLAAIHHHLQITS